MHRKLSFIVLVLIFNAILLFFWAVSLLASAEPIAPRDILLVVLTGVNMLAWIAFYNLLENTRQRPRYFGL